MSWFSKDNLTVQFRHAYIRNISTFNGLFATTLWDTYTASSVSNISPTVWRRFGPMNKSLTFADVNLKTPALAKINSLSVRPLTR